jgi:alpha-tubulin suppressor-like RCC1 family protein
VAGGLSFALVSAGLSHVCGVALDRDTYCWGGNENGQLGNGTKSGNQFVPGPVLGGMVFEEVSAGAYHTCGWMTSGRAFCWGRNLEGQLGGPDNFPLPTAVAGGHFFDQVSAGGIHTCGVTAGVGEVFCWGGNESGQLGDGTTTNRSIPTPIAP